MDQQKADFLKNEFPARLAAIDADTPPAWGKMNFRQMVEHMSYSVRMSSGLIPVQLLTPEEHIPKMHAFLASDKPFRENTPNPLLSDTPAPVRHETCTAAIAELQQELNYFFEVFEKEPGKKVLNASFGPLDFDLSIRLLHKHALHHLKQFGDVVAA